MNRTIIDFCAEEVGRQYAYATAIDGCRAVPGMIYAWEHAIKKSNLEELTETDILEWARLIEPVKNSLGYRSVGVRVGNSIPPKASEVPGRMKNFIANVKNGLTPEEAYLEFEAIHPFVDGNGRTGKIILFYLRGELEEPTHKTVPNPWGISNP